MNYAHKIYYNVYLIVLIRNLSQIIWTDKIERKDYYEASWNWMDELNKSIWIIVDCEGGKKL